MKYCIECGEPSKRLMRGRCQKHYNLWYKKNPPNGKPCAQDDCSRMANANNDYCHAHKMRHKNGWDMDKPIRVWQRWPNKTCRGPECDRPVHAFGLCPSHWNQQYQGRDLAPIRKPSILDDYCSYSMAHDRPTKLWGAAVLYECVECGNSAREWAYDGTDPNQIYGPSNRRGGGGFSYVYYSRYPEFYMPMCKKCHRKRDLSRAFSELQEYRSWKHATGLSLADVTPRTAEEILTEAAA